MPLPSPLRSVDRMIAEAIAVANCSHSQPLVRTLTVGSSRYAYSCFGRANDEMSELLFLPRRWPTQVRRRSAAFLWLIILWSVFSTFAEVNSLIGPQLLRGASISSSNNNHAVPSVSVRMSTSIVESANYQPAELEAASIQQQQQRDDNKQQYPLERGSRFFRSENSLAVRSDSSAHHRHLSPPINTIQTQPHAPDSGRILDSTPAGYRWSVSTSRNLSPAAAIQVLGSQSRAPTYQASPGYTRDRTPSAEHKLVDHHQRGLIRRILDGGQQAILDLRCEGRGVGKMLKSAKNMLQERVSSIEEHSGLLMFGSSLLAASIPLAVLYSNLMGGDGGGELTGAPNRRASLSSWAGESPLSSFVKHLSLQSRVDSVMGWIERSVEHLPNFPRLHPQECVKRSICEAHNEPNKYGAIGFTLRLLFPATNLSSTDRMDNMEYKVINKYRHAAGYGLNKRIDSNGTSISACREKYEDCLISLLDVARNMMDVFLR